MQAFLLIFMMLDHSILCDVISETENYITLLRSLYHPTDPLRTLRDITANSKSLFETSLPVSALIVRENESRRWKGNTTVEEDPDDARAVKLLHREMKEILDTISNKRPSFCPNCASYLDYDFITSNADEPYYLIAVYQDLLNPKYRIYKFFDEHCLHSAPDRILASLYHIYLASCPLPTVVSALRYVKLNRIMRMLEARLEKGIPSWDEKSIRSSKGALRWQIHDLSEDQTEEIFNTMQSWNPKQSDELAQLYSDLLKGTLLTSVRKSSCMIRIYNDGSNHERGAVTAMLSSLASKLMRIHILASACVNITFNGNKTVMDEYLNRMSTKIEQIGIHVYKWAGTSQALDWPLVSIDYAVAKLETSKSLIETKDYSATAQSIKEELELRGPANKGYQVIVTEHSHENESWHIHSLDENSHSSMVNLRGIDAHIFQYDQTVGNRSMNFEKSLDERLAGIAAIIRSRSPKTALDAGKVLKDEIGLIFEETGTKSVLILRKSGIFGSKIQLGKSEINETDVQRAIHLHFLDTSSMFANVYWNLSFFV